MKKKIVIKSLLILLPLLAVGLATTLDSVMVFDTLSGTISYGSYFEPAPVANLQMLPPTAAMLSLVSGILAAVWLGKRKPVWLKASGWTAFGAAIAACIPIVIRGEVLVVPNVGLPIFMMIHFGVTRYAEKLPAEMKEKKAPKLKARR